MNFEIVTLEENKVVMIDQRKLPNSEEYVTLSTYQEVAEAIRNMTVRGAPAIGVSAAMGYALGAMASKASDFDALKAEMTQISKELFETRPTAVNLQWGLNRMNEKLTSLANQSIEQIKTELKEEAIQIRLEDIETNKTMGRHGEKIIEEGDTILTHCNAGALATAGFGTALGVIYAAKEAGKTIKVIADETRPVLQGARLSAWELQKNEVPVTVITDNMAASLMSQGQIQKVIVGADRIAANGDTANKIGTYSVAINAKYHNIPFYVAAPFSTIDTKCESGKEIPIEERHPDEVKKMNGKAITPSSVDVFNPAFDVTPSELIQGIITEKGLFEYPYSF